MKQAQTFTPKCERCTHSSSDEVRVFPELEHWVALYLNEQLIHIHFNEVAYTDELTNQVAGFVRDTVCAWLKRYNTIHFFGVVDLHTLDSSLGLPKPAKECYDDILQCPNVGHVAAYGLTHTLREIVKLVTEDSPAPITLCATIDDAESAYQQWYTHHHEQTN